METRPTEHIPISSPSGPLPSYTSTDQIIEIVRNKCALCNFGLVHDTMSSEGPWYLGSVDILNVLG